MKIVADENIPSLHELFAGFGEIVALPGRSLSADQVKDADILLVRSVTPVNEALLAGSRVKFVGTCTIGIDHLDTEYLGSNNIAYASAPGCNAGGVLQYVLAALARLAPSWPTKRIGIIGCGNVGGRLCRTLLSLGVDCVTYDPYLTVADTPVLTDLQTVLACDVVCVHTPYTTEGPFPSHHLLNQQTLASLRPGAVLLNAGRGGAIDNAALLAHLEAGADWQVALDVWEGEPEIDLALMDKVALASPHIAGYSFEGRLTGSIMIHEALADFLGQSTPQLAAEREAILQAVLGPPEPLSCTTVNEAILASYAIADDDSRCRRSLHGAEPGGIGVAFDLLRKTYPKRREFSHFRVSTPSTEVARTLGNMGFLTDVS